MPSIVTAIPAAPPEAALEHFRALLAFETDCWDVHTSLAQLADDFVLVDVRSHESYASAHIAGAVNLPYREITMERLDEVVGDDLAVVYCAGPHCNAADRAAVRIAELGRPVKKMIGGLTGWLDEGFALR